MMRRSTNPIYTRKMAAMSILPQASRRRRHHHRRTHDNNAYHDGRFPTTIRMPPYILPPVNYNYASMDCCDRLGDHEINCRVCAEASYHGLVAEEMWLNRAAATSAVVVECPICLEEDAEPIAVARCCGQTLHYYCLQRWRSTSMNASCPLCRGKM